MSSKIFDFSNGDICWTNSPYHKDALQEVPYIEMVGWQQDWSSTIASISRWWKRVEGAGGFGKLANPYQGLYLGTPATTYKLPYLEEYHHNTSQNWEQNSSPLGEDVAEIVDVVRNAAAAIVPGAGVTYPKAYAGSAENSYSFTFNLLNTNAGGGGDIVSNVSKNQKFLHQFVADNLHDMTSSLTLAPPLIYEIYIPGIRWSPAAVVSNVTVSNKGTMNRNINNILIGLNTDYIYPDAWEVTVQIRELINESRALWADAVNEGGKNGIKTKVFPGRG